MKTSATLYIRLDCCAWAANAHGAQPTASFTNSRRRMCPPEDHALWDGETSTLRRPCGGNYDSAGMSSLSAQINAAIADPKMKARLADLGAVPMSMTPAEFGKFIAAETETLAQVIKAANIKPQ